jgi:hypothetical protein
MFTCAPCTRIMQITLICIKLTIQHIQNTYHIFLLILKFYCDCWFTICYRIRQLSVADRSINVQSCDVTMTLDIGLVPSSEDIIWRHLLLVSIVKQVCLLSRPGNIVVGPAKKKFLAFIPYKLRTNKRAEGTCINIFTIQMIVISH